MSIGGKSQEMIRLYELGLTVVGVKNATVEFYIC